MRRVPFYIRILAAMALGALIGARFGASASWLGELGGLIIQFIKALAAPLLFFAIIDSFIRTKVDGKRAAAMLCISAINTVLALLIGLGIANLVKPGQYLAPPPPGAQPRALELASKKIDASQTITQLLPPNVVQPFMENSMLTIIFLGVLFGMAARKAHQDGMHVIGHGAAACLRINEIVIGWVVSLVPLAVFGVVARTVGQQGFAPVKGLSIYAGVVLLGLGVQIGFVYQLWIALGLGLKRIREFWRGGRDAIAYALGASSSLATLPVTLNSLSRMGVSDESARLAACVGTNFNNDGILLYEAMAVLIVAQSHGIDLSVAEQGLAALSCIVAGIGIAGIPDAGLISLALVLGTVGLPADLLPLLLTVDWILSRARAATNVISDMLVATLIDQVNIEAKKTSSGLS